MDLSQCAGITSLQVGLYKVLMHELNFNSQNHSKFNHHF